MYKKTFFGIKVSDIENKDHDDYKQWEVIVIRAISHAQAKSDLKSLYQFEDIHLVPKSSIACRDVIHEYNNKKED